MTYIYIYSETIIFFFFYSKILFKTFEYFLCDCIFKKSPRVMRMICFIIFSSSTIHSFFFFFFHCCPKTEYVRPNLCVEDTRYRLSPLAFRAHNDFLREMTMSPSRLHCALSYAYNACARGHIVYVFTRTETIRHFRPINLLGADPKRPLISEKKLYDSRLFWRTAEHFVTKS